jgi:hypothetical protein
VNVFQPALNFIDEIFARAVAIDAASDGNLVALVERGELRG